MTKTFLTGRRFPGISNITQASHPGRANGTIYPLLYHTSAVIKTAIGLGYLDEVGTTRLICDTSFLSLRVKPLCFTLDDNLAVFITLTDKFVLDGFKVLTLAQLLYQLT